MKSRYGKLSKSASKQLIEVGILLIVGVIGLFVIIFALQNNTENRSKASTNPIYPSPSSLKDTTPPDNDTCYNWKYRECYFDGTSTWVRECQYVFNPFPKLVLQWVKIKKCATICINNDSRYGNATCGVSPTPTPIPTPTPTPTPAPITVGECARSEFNTKKCSKGNFVVLWCNPNSALWEVIDDCYARYASCVDSIDPVTGKRQVACAKG